MEAFAQRKADLQDNIAQLQTEAAEFKAKRKATNKHITYAELPEAAQFDRLSTQEQAPSSTPSKMISPTGAGKQPWCRIVRQKMKRHDDARSPVAGHLQHRG